MKTSGFAATAADRPLARQEFARRELRPDDVAIEIRYCGVCHTDLHAAHDDWGGTQYPLVPGHEIIGRVIAVGAEVTRHRVGDHVAVGTMVDSCGRCDACRKGEQQLCREGATWTFGAPDRLTGEITRGGYAKHIVVRQDFVLRVPAGLDLARAAPLLCAGITVYSPLRTWKVGAGSRVGVVGLGGLGHLAVKLAAGLGAEVSVLGRTRGKEADALALGARRFVVSQDATAMQKAASSFDLIIDTVPVKHDLNPYVPLLDLDGTLCVVGQLGPLAELNTYPLVAGRRRIAGSPSGGLRETQELLDFCAGQQIHADCEILAMAQVNEAFARLERGDVRYRFVLDLAGL
jgi:uncharacterized zinc-type alcohol dehydrogenase-like protein